LIGVVLMPMPAMQGWLLFVLAVNAYHDLYAPIQTFSSICVTELYILYYEFWSNDIQA